MTQEEQDAILGRTLRAYKEAKSKFGALKARTKEISTTAHDLASALDTHPSQILVTEGPVGTLRLVNASYVYRAEDAERLSLDTIQRHVAEYTEIEHQVEELRQMLLEQGHELKE